MKQCTVCKIDKPKTEFHKEAKGADGLCAKCKDCKCQQVRHRRANSSAAHREREREISKKYYEDNKEVISRKSRIYYANNIEREQERSRNFYYANPDKAKARRHTRLSRMRNGTPTWADKNYIKDLYANKIEANKIMADAGVNIVFEIDHIEPFSNSEVCGLHCEFNLQVLTVEENRAKHTNRVEFLEGVLS